MKRFLLSAFLFAALPVALLSVSVFFLPDQLLCNSMLGVERDKLSRLQQLAGSRIIFVGGSNVGHGFDSQIVEEAFHRPVMNMGLHAGLGLIYHMRSIEDYIRKDDIVVIVPEYEQFTDNCFGDEELLAMVSAIIPEHRKILDAIQWRHLLAFAPRYGARKLARFWTLWGESKHYAGYDEHGDNIGWRKSNVRLPFPSVTGRKGPELCTGEVLPYLNRFIATCHDKGATVCLLPPVHEDTSFQNEKPFIDEVARCLELNNTPFLVDPEIFKFPDEYFADTIYHLNGRGVLQRMEKTELALGQFILAHKVKK